jgi:hypothetical protein
MRRLTVFQFVPVYDCNFFQLSVPVSFDCRRAGKCLACHYQFLFEPHPRPPRL